MLIPHLILKQKKKPHNEVTSPIILKAIITLKEQINQLW